MQPLTDQLYQGRYIYRITDALETYSIGLDSSLTSDAGEAYACIHTVGINSMGQVVATIVYSYYTY